MEFTKSLLKGKLIKRYKRFFVDVNLNKEVVTAHCPNTGSMKGLLKEGNDVYLLKNDNPKRKLKYGLEIIKANKNLVGVNTHLANKIVNHGLQNNLIKELRLIIFLNQSHLLMRWLIVLFNNLKKISILLVLTQIYFKV